jgi:uncharacterized UBP type Zn finger protein
MRRMIMEHPSKLNICINNDKIEMTQSHRILGFIFDERINWKEHIKDVKVRAERKLNIIKSLHQMVILSTLRYGEAEYGLATSTDPKYTEPRTPQRHKTHTKIPRHL